MADTLGTIITKGWEDFKANPILIIPGIFTALVAYIYAFALLFSLFPDIMTAFSMMGSSMNMDPTVYESLFIESFNYEMFAIVMLAGLLFLLIFASFITAGLTGMAKETVQTGKTKMGDFFSYGAKYFFKTLFVTILLMVIILIPIILLSIIYIGIVVLATVIGSGAAVAISVLLTILYILLVIVIAIVISVFFYFPVYAAILDDYNVIDSFSKSYRLYKENKGDVIIFVLVLFVINFAVMFVMGMVSGLLNIIPIAGLFISTLLDLFVTSVLTALMTIWAVRMYYSLNEEKTEPVYREYQDFDEYAAIEEGILDSDNAANETVYEENVYEENISEDDVSENTAYSDDETIFESESDDERKE